MDTEQKHPILASITFVKGPLIGQVFSLVQPITTIGRQRDNDIVVPDQKVSRQHARLTWDNGAWTIEQLTPHNPLTMDQQPIQKAILQHDCTINLSDDTAFRVHLDASDQDSDATLRRATLYAPVNTAPMPLSVDSGTVPLVPAFAEMDTMAPDPTAAPTHPLPKASPNLSKTSIATFSALGIPSLEVTDNTSGQRNVYPLASERLSIGRARTNDIVIDDPIVSDLHLQIVRDEDKQWMLIHPHPDRQHTTNGLLYQGRTIRGNKSFHKPLTRGDVFRIADENGTLVTLTYYDGSVAPQAMLPTIQPIPLQAAPLTLGRVPDNDVVLDHPQVSAHHARLVPENATYRLTDLNSTNHTYVNGLIITNHLLTPDDEIRIGPFKLVYTGNELTQYNESESIRIDAENLHKVSANGTVLLNTISLSIPPRSFVALVGSSGAGKSTLLDALSGQRPAQQGSVFYNGQDYYSHLAAFRTQLGYVPQEDIIHRDLSVERALYYAAKLRLPGDFTQAQIEQRITDVLEDVEMTHRRTLLIKKLSGGQRKRVSIALELLANPSVFFLDEPTSGLDPGLDRKMMLLLRKLADKGHTILLVTHATNNINVCDAVCFLAQGGRLAYYGSPEDAKGFFQQPDFAEIYNCLEPTDEQPTIPQLAEERFKQSPTYHTYITKPLSQKPSTTRLHSSTHTKTPASAMRGNPWKQFVVLCQRYLELLWNDTWNLSILLLQAPIIGFILFILVRALNEATIFKPPISLFNQGDAQRFLFILSFAAVMFGSINAAREIIKEIHVYQRERTVNLGIVPYMLSKIVILGVLCLLQCALLLFIMSLAAHFYDGIFMPSVWEIYITLALTSLAGVMIGLTISAFVRNNDQAMSFIPLILIPQVVFSGSMFPLKGLPLQIFGIFFSLRWSMAALGSTLNLPGNGDKVFGTCDACNTYQHNLHYLIFTWLALVATILVLGTLTGFFLKRKDVRA